MEGLTKGSPISPLLPAQLGRLADPIESFQREDRVRQPVGAAIQDRAGKRQEFLRHCLCVRERVRLAGGIGMHPLVHAGISCNADARAEWMAAADLETILPDPPKFLRQ